MEHVNVTIADAGEQRLPEAVAGSGQGRASPRSLLLIVLAWMVLQIGGLFSPGLLDDVDSVYIEVAREMLVRHDFVTPYVDGIRFFDKPPLMYWMAAASMHLFGAYDWAARLPLALAFLLLLLAVYALGLRLFAEISPVRHPDRAALYAALALATSLGPYLYTRFFIPDILICLWMTLGVHLFLVAVERARNAQEHAEAAGSALLPCLGFAACLALNLLTKGLIGLVFPLAFALVYLAWTRQLRLLPKLHPVTSGAVFCALALPWHILAALANPSIAMPPGVGLPAKAGWAWFYLYNEHVARFVSKRIPHDYGQTPVWLFWLYALIWTLPWGAFLPAGGSALRRAFRSPSKSRAHEQEGFRVVVLWALIVLVFFSLSARQEYYSLPALPALALLAGAFLAQEEASPEVARACVLCHRWLLLPASLAAASTCFYFSVAAPVPAAGTDLSSLLAANPELYNLSLGHLFDLTGAAMGLFRGPLVATGVGMLVAGLGSYLLRRRGRTFRANLALAAGSVIVLLAVHAAFVRFNPILGSKSLADAIVRAEAGGDTANDRVLLDGELTSGSTLLFYTRQPVYLVNGRVNGPWFGSFWPDAPPIFVDEGGLRTLWAGPQRIFLLTYQPELRTKELAALGAVRKLASAGGKTILTNR